MEAIKNPIAPYEGQFDIQTRKQMVAQMLCECRKTMGYQQKEVAEILGISPQTYNGYEKGRNEPPIEILVRLSFLYSIPVDILVQRNRFHSDDQSAIVSIKKAEEELADVRQWLSSDPLAQNEQIQTLISAMERLTDASRQLAEKTERK